MADIFIKYNATAENTMQEESEEIFSLRLLENKIKMKEINKKKNSKPLIK